MLGLWSLPVVHRSSPRFCSVALSLSSHTACDQHLSSRHHTLSLLRTCASLPSGLLSHVGSLSGFSFVWHLSWEVESPSSSFSFSTLSSDIRSNQPISLSSFFSQKYPKVSCPRSSSPKFLKSVRRIQRCCFVCLCCHFMLWIASVRSTAGNRIISVSKSNHRRLPILETPEPIQKTHP